VSLFGYCIFLYYKPADILFLVAGTIILGTAILGTSTLSIINLFDPGVFILQINLNSLVMKSPRNKTEQKELKEGTKKAKGTEPENATSAKDAKKVVTTKKKSTK
jgi:hypothetical protein